jgi:TupA-like ATPgrasp
VINLEISDKALNLQKKLYLKAKNQTMVLSVAISMVGQVGLLVATGRRPQPATGNTIRGVDFYPWRDFIRALIQGAEMFKAAHGYLPRLASPTSFNEHLFARKFFAPLPLPSLADKLAAKEHVKARLGDEYLPAVAWVGDDVSHLLAAKPPTGRYVLKANHGSDSNLFLNLPHDFTAKRDEIVQWATRWLAFRYGYDWGEWQYCTFKPQLFLEEFIDYNGVHPPEDYKFFCFHGKACLIEVDVGRRCRAFYTLDWEYIPIAYRHAPIQCTRPCNLEHMIHVAEAIAEGMEFARVDLYSDGKSRIRFGEITFTPGSADLRFSDFKLDEWLGKQFSKDAKGNMPWDF